LTIARGEKSRAELEAGDGRVKLDEHLGTPVQGDFSVSDGGGELAIRLEVKATDHSYSIRSNSNAAKRFSLSQQ
jgi:hypothetical protein